MLKAAKLILTTLDSIGDKFLAPTIISSCSYYENDEIIIWAKNTPKMHLKANQGYFMAYQMRVVHLSLIQCTFRTTPHCIPFHVFLVKTASVGDNDIVELFSRWL